ncbi:MAG: c-type cytochrome, partial [Roseimicrobium sp.]
VCATCHGPNAEGHGPSAPALKDGWGFPAKPADLRQPHLRCGDEPRDIYRVLTTGLSGMPMLSFADTLTAEQRWDIAAFLMSVRLPSGPVLGAPASAETAP